MSKFDEKIYTALVGEFTRQLKVLRNYRNRKLPSKKEPQIYVEEIVESYNKLRNYISQTRGSLDEPSQKEIPGLLNEWNEKLVSHIAILNFKVEIPNDCNEIDINTINDISDEESEELSKSVVEQTEETEATEEPEIDSDNINISIGIESVTQHRDDLSLNLESAANTDTTENSNTNKMVQTKEDVLKLCAPTLNYKFSGDSTKLEGFINDIEMLREVVIEPNHAFFLKVIKAKLDSRALEAINEKATTIDTFIKELRSVAKPETSKVIEGKLLALRMVVWINIQHRNLQNNAKS